MTPTNPAEFTGQVASYFTIALLAGPDGGYEIHVGSHGSDQPEYVPSDKPMDIAAMRVQTPLEAITMCGALLLRKLRDDGFHGIEMAEIEVAAHDACEKHGLNN